MGSTIGDCTEVLSICVPEHSIQILTASQGEYPRKLIFILALTLVPEAIYKFLPLDHRLTKALLTVIEVILGLWTHLDCSLAVGPLALASLNAHSINGYRLGVS